MREEAAGIKLKRLNAGSAEEGQEGSTASDSDDDLFGMSTSTSGLGEATTSMLETPNALRRSSAPGIPRRSRNISRQLSNVDPLGAPHLDSLLNALKAGVHSCKSKAYSSQECCPPASLPSSPGNMRVEDGCPTEPPGHAKALLSNPAVPFIAKADQPGNSVKEIEQPAAKKQRVEPSEKIVSLDFPSAVTQV